MWLVLNFHWIPIWSVVSTPLKIHLAQSGIRVIQGWNGVGKNVWNHKKPPTSYKSYEPLNPTKNPTQIPIIFSFLSHSNPRFHPTQIPFKSPYITWVCLKIVYLIFQWIITMFPIQIAICGYPLFSDKPTHQPTLPLSPKSHSPHLTLHGVPTTSCGVQQDIHQVVVQKVHLAWNDTRHGTSVFNETCVWFIIGNSDIFGTSVFHGIWKGSEWDYSSDLYGNWEWNWIGFNGTSSPKMRKDGNLPPKTCYL